MPRERMRDHDARDPGGPGGDGDGRAPELRRADDLLAAGDDVIRRALSANSEQFLRQNAQSGGQ